MKPLSDSRWSLPEREIWSLVCGMPEAKARRQPLLMLKLYVDDSGKAGHSPVMVLAGYLADAEQWAAFSNEWQALLDEARVPIFKMADAWRLGADWQHLGALGRDQLIARLIGCIRRHARMAFINSMPIEGFNHYLRVKEDPAHHLSRVYVILFYSFLSRVYKHAYLYHFDQRVEVVFDEQGGESQRSILSMMDEFRDIARSTFRNLIMPSPAFRTDQDMIPLQAADMLAWLVRREAYNKSLGKDVNELPEQMLLTGALDMPRDVFVWTEDRLAGASQHLIDTLIRLTQR